MQPAPTRSRFTRAAAVVLVAVLAVLLVTGKLPRLGTPAGELGGATATPGGPVATSATTAAPSPAPPAASPGASGSGPAPDVVLVAAGDIGRCDATTDDATGALAASLPGVVATLGDTAYEDGTQQELEQCFGGSWGAVKDRIRFAVTGNHDLHTDDGAPLRAYLPGAASRDGRTWFSDDLGPWHVVVLDANCGLAGIRCRAGSDQVRWLEADLAASRARCTLALWHQPRFSSGDHGDDKAVGPFWDALYAAGAELVLNGHDHDYERFAPQAPDATADAAAGITEIVVGTGGATLEPFKDPRPNSMVRLDDAYGVLELTLGVDGWSSRFLDTGGIPRDQGTGTCH